MDFKPSTSGESQSVRAQTIGSAAIRTQKKVEPSTSHIFRFVVAFFFGEVFINCN